MKKSFLLAMLLTAGLSFSSTAHTIQAQTQKSNAKESAPLETGSGIVAQKPDAETEIVFLTAFEQDIINELNLLRSDPQAYAGYLEEYRKFYNGKIVTVPNRPAYRSIEGITPLDEAISLLKETKPLDSLKASALVSRASKDHLRDMIDNSIFSHTGSDGSTAKDRLNKYLLADSFSFGENIVKASLPARELVFRMLIDDGTPTRQHRKNLLNPAFKFIGLSKSEDKSEIGLQVLIFTSGESEKGKTPAKQTFTLEIM